MLNVRLKLCRNHRREKQQYAQLNTLWATDAMRNAHRQAGIIGLFSPCHMPINELFREGGEKKWGFLPNQCNKIQSPFFFCLAASFNLRHLAPGSRLAGSANLLSKLATNRKAERQSYQDQIRNGSNLSQQNFKWQIRFRIVLLWEIPWLIRMKQTGKKKKNIGIGHKRKLGVIKDFAESCRNNAHVWR